jgi:hypothetical protein
MSTASATIPAMSAPVKATEDGPLETPEPDPEPVVAEPVVEPEVTGAPTVNVSAGEVEPL